MHKKLAELDRGWSYLRLGHSFRENWIFWFIPSFNFSLKIKLMWLNYESSRRIIFPEGATIVGSEVFESPIWDTCPSRQIQEFSSEKFSVVKLDSWTNSKQCDTEIRTAILLRKFTYSKSSYERQKNLFMTPWKFLWFLWSFVLTPNK